MMLNSFNMIFGTLVPLNTTFSYLKQFTNFNFDFLKMVISWFRAFGERPILHRLTKYKQTIYHFDP